MHLAGSPSYVFAEDASQVAHVALYVRDALGLDVAQDPCTPPALTGSVPDRRHLIAPETRDQAALQWPSWWAAVVAIEGEENLGRPPRPSDYESWLANRRPMGLPPDYEGLWDRPQLQQSVARIFREADDWTSAARRALQYPVFQSEFQPSLTTRVAQEVANAKHVDVGSVHGCVLVLAVEGIWRHQFSPGVALCSQSAAEETLEAERVLRGVLSFWFRRIGLLHQRVDVGGSSRATMHLRSAFQLGESCVLQQVQDPKQDRHFRASTAVSAHQHQSLLQQAG